MLQHAYTLPYVESVETNGCLNRNRLLQYVLKHKKAVYCYIICDNKTETFPSTKHQQYFVNL